MVGLTGTAAEDELELGAAVNESELTNQSELEPAAWAGSVSDGDGEEEGDVVALDDAAAGAGSGTLMLTPALLQIFFAKAIVAIRMGSVRE